MLMMNILLIEDEQNVASFIKIGLQEEGYELLIATDGQAGLDLLTQNEINLVILDIILPGINGLEVCKKIRWMGYKDLPVLMLTALGTTDNIVAGLDSGADDYMIKPFKFKELSARIRSLLRRNNVNDETLGVLSIIDLKLDLSTKTANRGGKEIKLTYTEYRLLEYFMKNQRKVLSRTDLLENVWGINFDLGTNVVDVYLNYLRNKVDKGFGQKLIHTVVGMGYVMKEECS
jgi:two-component system, OmpR family, copper resistance phosphate regulon response regulator CusR